MDPNRPVVPERGRCCAGAVELEELRIGHGPPLVVLHGEDGLLFAGPFLSALGEHFSVRAPLHPGWGASPRPPEVTSVDDLSYVYLDYFAGLGQAVPVIGLSLGAWLAAAVAVKDSSAFASLVLASPIGIKISDRETRDFLDIYAVGPAEAARAVYGDGSRPDLSRLDEEEFHQLALAQEMVARVAWRPYLHDPKLRGRLARINVPTLVARGAEDGLVLRPDEYFDAWVAAIGASASLVTLPGGHRLEEQCPDQLAALVSRFVATGAGAGAATGLGELGAEMGVGR